MNVQLVESSGIEVVASGSGTGPRQAERFGYGRGWLVGNLPVVMTEDPFLARFVTIFEEIASTARYGADGCVRASDVTVAAPSMLRFLGGWLGAPDIHESLPLDVQRRIVRAASTALRWRGTAQALALLLEAVTGAAVEIDEPGGVFRDGTAPPTMGRPVVVRVASTGHLAPDELVALVRDEVPADLQIVVIAADEVLWPPPASEPADRPLQEIVP